MKRPEIKDYPEQFYFEFINQLNKYIDHVESENEGLKVQMIALQDAVNELQDNQVNLVQWVVSEISGVVSTPDEDAEQLIKEYNELKK